MRNERTDSQEPTAYLEELYLYAYDILGQKEDAEDAVARTYAKMYERKNLERAEDKKSYLFRSVHNTCVDMLRAKRRDEGVFSTDREPMTPETVSDGPETTADHRIIRSEVFAELWRAVESIPEKYRVIFLRHCLNGESFVSIAATLGLTPQTVSTRYQKAEDHLRIRFSGRDLALCLLLVWLIRAFYAHIF